jgi:hypothetical protein
MKTVLMIGAAICCIIGALIILRLIAGIIEFSPDFFNAPGFFMPAFCIAYGLLACITFTPMLILIRSKQTEQPRVQFIVAGSTELVVIGLFSVVIFRTWF